MALSPAQGKVLLLGTFLNTLPFRSRLPSKGIVPQVRNKVMPLGCGPRQGAVRCCRCHEVVAQNVLVVLRYTMAGQAKQPFWVFRLTTIHDTPGGALPKHLLMHAAVSCCVMSR